MEISVAGRILDMLFFLVFLSVSFPSYEIIIHLHRNLQPLATPFAPLCAGCFSGQTCSLEHLIRASLRRRPDLFHLEPTSNDMKAVENQKTLAFMTYIVTISHFVMWSTWACENQHLHCHT